MEGREAPPLPPLTLSPQVRSPVVVVATITAAARQLGGGGRAATGNQRLSGLERAIVPAVEFKFKLQKAAGLKYLQ